MTEGRYEHPRRSRVEMTQIVLPGDTNAQGSAFGGKIMQWVDIAGAVAARRHAGILAVTASIDSLNFEHPVHLGDVVVLRASVNRSWTTSMEVGVRVDCEAAAGTATYHAVRAYLTFVALDMRGRPCSVPALVPQSDEEVRRFDDAERRRDHRLALRKRG